MCLSGVSRQIAPAMHLFAAEVLQSICQSIAMPNPFSFVFPGSGIGILANDSLGLLSALKTYIRPASATELEWE